MKIDAPDLIVHNANIVTLDDARPKALALAVRGERIAAAGGDREILSLAGPRTRVIDARGLTVLPGFNDNHLHALGMGIFFDRPNLFGKNADEIVAILTKKYSNLKPGQAVTGFAWDYSSCPDPSKEILDRAFPRNPVILRQYSGHAQWVNSLALRSLLKIEARSRAGGGEIVRDANGEPTGIVRGSVVHPTHHRDIIRRALNTRLHRELLRISLDRFARAGITSVQDNTWQPFSVWLLRSLENRGKLTARFSCWPFGHYPLLARSMRFAPYDRFWIRRGPVKYIVDGAFSPHTAWMIDPYAGEPGNHGQAVIKPERLKRIVTAAARRGRRVPRRGQLAFHAIGDRAVREVIDAVEKAARVFPWVTRMRIRLEHAQIIDPADVPRLRRLGMLVAAQPTALALRERDRALVGEARFNRLYPYRSLLDAGAPLSFGSDIPGEIEYDPFQAIYRAVARRGVNPEEAPYDRNEAVTVEEAVRAYTRGSAYAEFMEDHKGALAPGLLADFILLSQDIFTVAPERIPETRALLTVTGGRIVHDAM
ncbi:MAG: amidohydrolase [Spirochaetales bacterium]|nr:amidohydrolase [Spirochaetales bacterium]